MSACWRGGKQDRLRGQEATQLLPRCKRFLFLVLAAIAIAARAQIPSLAAQDLSDNPLIVNGATYTTAAGQQKLFHKMLTDTVDDLLRVSPNPNLRYRLHIIADDSINACTALSNKPGVNVEIVITRGLLHFMLQLETLSGMPDSSSLDSIAYIINHELGHYFNGDLERLEALQRPNVSETEKIKNKAHSQEAEMAADKYSLENMAKARRNPAAAIATETGFEKLQKSQPQLVEKLIADHPGLRQLSFVLSAELERMKRLGKVPEAADLPSRPLPYHSEDLEKINPFHLTIDLLRQKQFSPAIQQLAKTMKSLEDAATSLGYQINLTSSINALYREIQQKIPQLKNLELDRLQRALDGDRFPISNRAEKPLSSPSLYIEPAAQMRFTNLLRKGIDFQRQRLIKRLPPLNPSLAETYRLFLQQENGQRSLPWYQNEQFLTALRIELNAGERPVAPTQKIFRQWLGQTATAAEFKSLLALIESSFLDVDTEPETREQVWKKARKVLAFDETLTLINNKPRLLVNDDRASLGGLLTLQNVDEITQWLTDALTGKTCSKPAAERLSIVQHLFLTMLSKIEYKGWPTLTQQAYIEMAKKLQQSAFSLYPAELTVEQVYLTWFAPEFSEDAARKRGTWLLAHCTSLEDAVRRVRTLDHDKLVNMYNANALILGYQERSIFPKELERAQDELVLLLNMTTPSLPDGSLIINLALQMIQARSKLEEKTLLAKVLLHHFKTMTPGPSRKSGFNLGLINRLWSLSLEQYYGNEFQQRLQGKTPQERLQLILELFYLHDFLPPNGKIILLPSIDIDKLFEALTHELRKPELKLAPTQVKDLLLTVFAKDDLFSFGRRSQKIIWDLVQEASDLQTKLDALKDDRGEYGNFLQAYRSSFSDEELKDVHNPTQDEILRLLPLLEHLFAAVHSENDFNHFFELYRTASIEIQNHIGVYYPGSEADRLLGRLQHQIIAWYRGQETPNPEMRLAEIWQWIIGMDKGKGIGVKATSVSDELFDREIAPRLLQQSPDQLHKILAFTYVDLEGRRHYSILQDALRQKWAKALLLQRHLTSPQQALQVMAEIYPESNWLRDELVTAYTAKATLSREELAAAEALYSKNRTETLPQAIAGRSLWPLVYEMSPRARLEVLMWLCDLEALPAQGPGAKELASAMAQANLAQPINKPFRSIDQLKGLYYSLDPQLRPYLFQPFFYDEKGLLRAPELAQKIRDKFLEVAAAPDVLQDIYKAFLSSLDFTRLTLFYAQIYPELAAYRRAPEKLASRIFDHFGPVGVKMKQLLAQQRGLIPDTYCQEFNEAKEHAMPLPKVEALALLEQYMKQPWTEVFAEIGEELGSASIKVVYRAKLKDGRRVVIKIQREAVASQVAEDMKLLRSILSEMSKNGLRRLEPLLRNFLADLERMLGYEVNFLRECDNARRLKKEIDERQRKVNLEMEGGELRIVLPEVIAGLHGEKWMVETEAPGMSLKDLRALEAAGLNMPRLAKAIVDEVADEIFNRRFFDPDRHGGNMKIEGDNLYFIDLGQAFEITASKRNRLARMLNTLQKGSAAEIARAWLQLVDRPSAAMETELSQKIAAYLQGVAAESRERDAGELFNKIFHLNNELALPTSKGYMSLFKALSYLDEWKAYLPPDYLSASLRRAIENGIKGDPLSLAEWLGDRGKQLLVKAGAKLQQLWSGKKQPGQESNGVISQAEPATKVEPGAEAVSTPRPRRAMITDFNGTLDRWLEGNHQGVQKRVAALSKIFDQVVILSGNPSDVAQALPDLPGNVIIRSKPSPRLAALLQEVAKNCGAASPSEVQLVIADDDGAVANTLSEMAKELKFQQVNMLRIEDLGQEPESFGQAAAALLEQAPKVPSSPEPEPQAKRMARTSSAPRWEDKGNAPKPAPPLDPKVQSMQEQLNAPGTQNPRRTPSNRTQQIRQMRRGAAQHRQQRASAQQLFAYFLEESGRLREVSCNLQTAAEPTAPATLQLQVVSASGQEVPLSEVRLGLQEGRIVVYEKSGRYIDKQWQLQLQLTLPQEADSETVYRLWVKADLALNKPEAARRLQLLGIDSLELLAASGRSAKADPTKVEQLQAILGLNELEMIGLRAGLEGLRQELSAAPAKRREELQRRQNRLQVELNRREQLHEELSARPSLSASLTQHGGGMLSLIGSQVIAEVVDAVMYGRTQGLKAYLRSLVENPQGHLVGYAEFSVAAEVVGALYNKAYSGILNGLKQQYGLPVDWLSQLEKQKLPGFAGMLEAANPMLRETIILAAGMMLPKLIKEGKLTAEDAFDFGALGVSTMIVHGVIKGYEVARGASAVASLNPIAGMLRFAAILVVEKSIKRWVKPIWQRHEWEATILKLAQGFLAYEAEVRAGRAVDKDLYTPLADKSRSGNGETTDWPTRLERLAKMATSLWRTTAKYGSTLPGPLGSMAKLAKQVLGNEPVEPVRLADLDLAIALINQQEQQSLLEKYQEFFGPQEEILTTLSKKACLVAWMALEGGLNEPPCDWQRDLASYRKFREIRQHSANWIKAGVVLTEERNYLQQAVQEAGDRLYRLYESEHAAHAEEMNALAQRTAGLATEVDLKAIADNLLDKVPSGVVPRLWWEVKFLERVKAGLEKNGGPREEILAVDTIIDQVKEKRITGMAEVVQWWEKEQKRAIAPDQLHAILESTGLPQLYKLLGGQGLQFNVDQRPTIPAPEQQRQQAASTAKPASGFVPIGFRR